MTPTSVARRSIRFVDWELRPAERCLLVHGQPVELGAKAFDVLLALAERPGQPISRDELLEFAWPGLYVEANNVSVQVHGLRRLLGNEAIKTVAKYGYQLASARQDGDIEPVAPVPVPGLASADVTPIPAREASRGNLGTQSPRLFGRDAVLSDLAAVIRRRPLVRLVGIGGAGKTRLAQAVGHLLAPEFTGGAWMVELAPVTAPDQVATTVARSLELMLPGIGTPFDEVIVEIGTAPRLLILDNCEHLHDAVEAFVRALLKGDCRPGLRVLVTSQRTSGDSSCPDFPLGELDQPPPGASLEVVERSAAAQLLLARVQALRPAFRIDTRNADDIGEICRSLGGLPLALELVAARLRLMGASEVARKVVELLPLLSQGDSSLPQRQRSITAALEWSHRLLTAGQQRAFCRLGVFAGSFDVEMAIRVLADESLHEWAVLDCLGGLADMSLLNIDDSEPPRCRMRETTRAFAASLFEDSDEREVLRGRHARALVERFERSQACRWDMASQDRTALFLPDLDDALAALAWTRANGRGAWYVELTGGCAWLWESTGQVRQGQELCEHGLDLLSGVAPGGVEGLLPEHHARLLLAYCSLAHYKPIPGKLDMASHAVAMLEGVRAKCGKDGAEGERVDRLLYAARGRFAITAATNKAKEHGLEATRLMAQAPYHCWGRLAEWDYINACDYVVNQLGDLDEAARLAARGRALARREGDLSKQLFALIAREQCAAARGRFGRAVRAGRVAVAFSRRLPFAEKLAVCLANLVADLIQSDRLDEAEAEAHEAYELEERAGNLWQDLEAFALLACKRGGKSENAAHLIGCSIYNNKFRDGGREPVESAIHETVMSRLRAAFTPVELERLLEAGAALNDAEAVRRILPARPVKGSAP